MNAPEAGERGGILRLVTDGDAQSLLVPFSVTANTERVRKPLAQGRPRSRVSEGIPEQHKSRQDLERLRTAGAPLVTTGLNQGREAITGFRSA